MSNPRPGTNYNARLVAAQRQEADRAALAHAVVLQRAADCASDRHRTETDGLTGDEVCRHCGVVANEPERQIRGDLRG